MICSFYVVRSRIFITSCIIEYLNSIQADLYHKYGEVLDAYEDTY